EMYFFRGYLLYLLLQQYGPVAIPPDGLVDVNDEAGKLMVERNTYDDCVDYIIENMEEACKYLPANRESASDIFRPTSGVALAVMSRVLLVAASPQYNGNTAYTNWVRSDGTPFITQTSENSKWGKAAVASRRLIETGLYRLYTYPRESGAEELPSNVPDAPFPNGAGNIDPYRSCKYPFIGEVMPTSNPELIWGTQVAPTGGDSPLWNSSPASLGGGCGLNITQPLVDAFRMKDGSDINDSGNEYPYPGEDQKYLPVASSKSMGGFTVYTSNTARMYENREARFYTTIGFSHSFWPGTNYSGSEAVTNYEVTYYSDGTAAPTVNYPDDYNHTGYTCIKYNHPTDNLKGSQKSKVFPIFRYAEILLNYAEALNELDGSYTDEATGITVTRNMEEIKSAFNQVRFRAGLPGLSPAELASRESLREAIKRERQVEFACEGRRYHDLRRWMDAPDAYNAPVVGMNVRAKSSEREKYYTRTTLNSNLTQRSWSFKMYFWPIPKSALDKNSRLVQNPGW
ncbi:RagB/SusD family nutrient uptake outer membrane protein, partial [Marinilabilia sp.]|uniref:RagB/SusD family nutrient uptake outer membrane protein n=1 Tax=Marinilabilia sp. TaxID=2021252 RepID=UPI0025C6760D